MAVNYVASCVAEFIGTFLLVLAVGCNVLGNNQTWGAVSIACTLMVMIYAFASVSGSHFNPAVSVALGIAKKVPGGWKQVAAYCIAQVFGAAVASVSFFAVFAKGVPVGPKDGFAIGACLCEILYTFMLCFVVLNAAASNKNAGRNQFFGLAIGFVIIAGGYGSAPLGAGCFNPAVALGLLFSSFAGVGWCAVYTVAELLGAGLAVALFRVLRPEEATDDRPPKEYSLTSKLLGEGIGTYMLVLTVGLNVLGGSKAAAFSIAAALTCMIYAIGDVSGGHFNPAVTVAIHSCGKDQPDVREAAKYIGVQLLAGILAAFTYAVAHRGATFPLGPGIGHNWASVAFVEAVFTFVLTSVVLCVACADKCEAEQFVGFIVGACVLAGGNAAGGISGGSLNPAVSCGVAAAHIMGGGLFWKSIIYSISELAGAGAAAGIFRVVKGGAASELESLVGSKLGSKV